MANFKFFFLINCFLNFIFVLFIFNLEKNAVFGEVIKQLNDMLEKLLNGGSSKVILKDIKPFIRSTKLFFSDSYV